MKNYESFSQSTGKIYQQQSFSYLRIKVFKCSVWDHVLDNIIENSVYFFPLKLLQIVKKSSTNTKNEKIKIVMWYAAFENIQATIISDLTKNVPLYQSCQYHAASNIITHN